MLRPKKNKLIKLIISLLIRRKIQITLITNKHNDKIDNNKNYPRRDRQPVCVSEPLYRSCVDQRSRRDGGQY